MKELAEQYRQETFKLTSQLREFSAAGLDSLLKPLKELELRINVLDIDHPTAHAQVIDLREAYNGLVRQILQVCHEDLPDLKSKISAADKYLAERRCQREYQAANQLDLTAELTGFLHNVAGPDYKKSLDFLKKVFLKAVIDQPGRFKSDCLDYQNGMFRDSEWFDFLERAGHSNKFATLLEYGHRVLFKPRLIVTPIATKIASYREYLDSAFQPLRFFSDDWTCKIVDTFDKEQVGYFPSYGVSSSAPIESLPDDTLCYATKKQLAVKTNGFQVSLIDSEPVAVRSLLEAAKISDQGLTREELIKKLTQGYGFHGASLDQVLAANLIKPDEKREARTVELILGNNSLQYPDHVLLMAKAEFWDRISLKHLPMPESIPDHWKIRRVVNLF